jgi:hypothetical protein
VQTTHAAHRGGSPLPRSDGAGLFSCWRRASPGGIFPEMPAMRAGMACAVARHALTGGRFGPGAPECRPARRTTGSPARSGRSPHRIVQRHTPYCCCQEQYRWKHRTRSMDCACRRHGRIGRRKPGAPACRRPGDGGPFCHAARSDILRRIVGAGRYGRGHAGGGAGAR